MPRFIDIPRCTVSHKYPKVGRCIYCGVDGAEAELAEEHILPESIGGMMRLPASSCHRCMGETHALEGRVVSRLYGNARAHLGTRRKKNKKFGETFGVRTHRGGRIETVQVSMDDHPGAIVTAHLRNVPGMLRTPPPQDRENWGNADIGIWLAPGAMRNIEKIGGRVQIVPGDVPFVDFARFLAKIAHSYATALIGVGNFRPFLADSATAIITKELPYYVGGSLHRFPPSADTAGHLHPLMLARLDHQKRLPLWMVTVQLFAQLGFPIYDVVVGEVTKPLE